MSRTKKKKRTGAKAVSSRCCNHGSCDYCLSNRMHKHNKRKVNDGTLTDYGIKQDRENTYETEAEALPDGTDYSNLPRPDAP